MTVFWRAIGFEVHQSKHGRQPSTDRHGSDKVCLYAVDPAVIKENVGTNIEILVLLKNKGGCKSHERCGLRSANQIVCWSHWVLLFYPHLSQSSYSALGLYISAISVSNRASAPLWIPRVLYKLMEWLGKMEKTENFTMERKKLFQLNFRACLMFAQSMILDISPGRPCIWSQSRSSAYTTTWPLEKVPIGGRRPMHGRPVPRESTGSFGNEIPDIPSYDKMHAMAYKEAPRCSGRTFFGCFT
ncbi:tRNA N6-adenosine threonylcarbamoyltransferase [Striga asiatica]|uniref:tRNA N6-adenosine threonylcarbamoyltransferase n=1 Tax=Striga asiatica TaxID=4170 RepID=A0A5A7QQX1_STRAF|nr:tRNA N6-adenosine threonylcarbamoyltransferase [Striga asiatica]